MKTIYKYPLDIVQRQTVDIPVQHELLHVGTDPHGTLCVWAEIDTEYNAVPVQFHLVGTGHEMPRTPSRLRHLGSAVQGPFVWHIFTPINPPIA